MTRRKAIDEARAMLQSGALRADIARRIAMRSASEDTAQVIAYLSGQLAPELEALGFKCRLVEQARAKSPFLLAERKETPDAVTILGYGHADVVPGQDDGWDAGLSPWVLTERNGRWYGRGTADNKGQHAINLAAMRAVLKTRGSLGFNAIWLFEGGEELGSPGIRELAREQAAALKADVLIASDGPRLSREEPTIFLGARGTLNLDLTVSSRDSGYHSGNWGGLLSNPGIILAHAIAGIVGPTGQIRLPDLVPGKIPDTVRAALADCVIEQTPDDPAIEPWWGEPGLTSAEKVFGWSSFEVLAFACGNPKAPVNAIPPRAFARCQLRFVVGVSPDRVIGAIRRHLDAQGLGMVQVSQVRDSLMEATRLDPADAWVSWASDSIEASLGRRPAILPNIGGSLPNDAFADILGLPTLWIPHSYPGCLQHAPNEHVPLSIVDEGLAMMAGLYWDLGEAAALRARDAHRAARG